PLLHHPCLLRRRVRHAAAVIDEEVSHRAKFARSSLICASACASRSRLSGALSQRFCPDGCGSGTITGRSPNRLPTRSSREPGPRKREIDIWPTRIKTLGLSRVSSASSQCAQLATAAGGGRRSPVFC